MKSKRVTVSMEVLEKIFIQRVKDIPEDVRIIDLRADTYTRSVDFLCESASWPEKAQLAIPELEMASIEEDVV